MNKFKYFKSILIYGLLMLVYAVTADAFIAQSQNQSTSEYLTGETYSEQSLTTAKIVPANIDTPSKKCVGDFFRAKTILRQENEAYPLETQQDTFLSSIKTVSGRSYFISPDPLGIDGGVNVYAYANLNPLFFVDPLGLCADGGGWRHTVANAFVSWRNNLGKTVQLGIYGSGGGSSGGNGSAGIAVSVSWRYGLQVGSYQTAGGGSYMGANGSIGLEVSKSLNLNINDLKGTTLEFGGSGGEGLSAGGSLNIPINNANNDIGKSIITVNIGPGGGSPGEGHVFYNRTWIQRWFGIPNPFAGGNNN